MGVENNNVVIATTWNENEVARIKTWVHEIKDKFWESLFIFGPVAINSKTTVVMVPDGSKEGWEESDRGDELRSKFIAEIEKANYGDGSSPWDYVEVGFGEFGQKVLRGNCKNVYGHDGYAD